MKNITNTYSTSPKKATSHLKQVPISSEEMRQHINIMKKYSQGSQGSSHGRPVHIRGASSLIDPAFQQSCQSRLEETAKPVKQSVKENQWLGMSIDKGHDVPEGYIIQDPRDLKTKGQPVMSQSPNPQLPKQGLKDPNKNLIAHCSQEVAIEHFSQFEINQNLQPTLEYYSCSSHKDQGQLLADKKKPDSSCSKGEAGSSKKAGASHKKSQSLFNKKIANIIQGLQQSLGIITTNVKKSFNMDELNHIIKSNGQKQTLVESALLAQRLAKMTSQMNCGQHKSSKQSDVNKKKHSRRPSAKLIGSNIGIDNYNSSNGFKTIEETVESLMQSSSSNRVSQDPKQPVKSTAKSIHQRTKSDIQKCRKQGGGIVLTKSGVLPFHAKHNTLLASSNQTAVSGHHKRDASIKHPNSQQEKPYCDIAVHRQPEQQIRQRKMSGCFVKSIAAQATIDNSRSSLSLMPNKSTKTTTKQSVERLSDANFLAKVSKQGNGLFMNNLSQGQFQIDSKLKSAASSPSLNAQTKKEQPIKKKQLQIFDFSQGATLENHAKIIQKKKQSGVQQKPKTLSAQTHKRSISDAQTLHKVFNSKLSTTKAQPTSQNVAKTIEHSGVTKQPVIKNFPTPSQMNLKPPFAVNKEQITSRLHSKRPSTENGFSKTMHNSPKPVNPVKNQTTGTAKNPKNRVCEMKSFLSKQASNHFQQNQALIQAMHKGSDGLKAEGTRGTRSTATGSNTNGSSTTLSAGSSNVGATHSSILNAKQAIRTSNKFNRPTYSNIPSNFVNSQQRSIEYPEAKKQPTASKGTQRMASGHKRVKSDAIKQSDLAQQIPPQCVDQAKFSSQPQKQLKIASNLQKKAMNLASQVNYERDMSQGSVQPPQMIYSARVSPSQTKKIHYNFEETAEEHRYCGNSALPTNRNDKSGLLKAAKPVFSNYTEQSKVRKENGPHYYQETANKNYILDCQAANQQRESYYHQRDGCQVQPPLSQQLYGEVNTLLSKASIYSDPNECPYPQDEKRLHDYWSVQSVSQSPKLNIIPTPKAVQPGADQQLPAQNEQNKLVLDMKKQYSPKDLSSLNSQPSMICGPPGNNQTQFKSYDRLPTFETNITSNDNYSPRTKNKVRLIKHIKASFNKLKEPIKTTSEFYRVGKMLGKGAFGRVNLAIHKLCESLVAVKSINKQLLSQDEDSKKKVMQEVLILQKTRHCNIVRLFDSFETNQHIVFVMELCAGGDLLNYVRKRRKLKEDVAKYVLKQVVDGLAYCHAKGIVHRDIKLDNLLLDDEGAVKICDFGVSKLLKDRNEVMTEQCGTPAYIAPEILKDKGYRGFGVDIWSLGVCLYAMLYGTVPFKASNMSDLHQLILKAKYSLKDDKVEISDDAKDLIKSLLEPDHTKRPTIRQVMNHKWLQEAQVKGAFANLEIFTAGEKQKILKDFTYQDMSRYRRNMDQLANMDQELQQTTENFFTEHALDSTQNALLKNNTTKSVVLAPFNSTMSHIQGEQKDDEGNSILPPLVFDRNLLANKKAIKFAARVKDINRQYEMNNNCELDNGVYNKFVKESTENLDSQKSPEIVKEDLLSLDNSLATSMNNKDCNKRQSKGGMNAPLGTQNSEEEYEAAFAENNKRQSGVELQEIQSFLLTYSKVPSIEEQQLIIEHDVVEKVEEFGYPRAFIMESLENYEMNDSATCYFLLVKERLNSLTQK